jgi:rhodanese-related sulfurtransferase
MGQSTSINKINFEDIQYSLKNHESFILINTLGENEQDCILPNTIKPEVEIKLINKLIQNGNKDVKIIVYGKNSNDDTIHKQYDKLTSLGFTNVFLYTGGLFEWLLLQDIYGENEFPTTKKELDILKFKSRKILDIKLIEY